MFDYLIGNADNHLKNFALLYGPNLTSPIVAPMYDIVSTAAYGQILPEMGVSFGGSRKIYDVNRSDIENAIKRTGMPSPMMMMEFDMLVENIPKAIDEAKESLVNQGFEEAEYVADIIKSGFEHRKNFDHIPAPTLEYPSSARIKEE